MNILGLGCRLTEILEIYKVNMNSYLIDTRYQPYQNWQHLQNSLPSPPKTVQNIWNMYLLNHKLVSSIASCFPQLNNGNYEELMLLMLILANLYVRYSDHIVFSFRNLLIFPMLALFYRIFICSFGSLGYGLDGISLLIFYICSLIICQLSPDLLIIFSNNLNFDLI